MAADSRSTPRFVDSSNNAFIYVSSVNDIDHESIRNEIGSLERAKAYLKSDLKNIPKFSRQWDIAKRIVDWKIANGWKPPANVDLDLIISITAFTVEDAAQTVQLYTELNNASRELGKSKDSWKNFRYKGWYAMMAHALSTLPTSPKETTHGAAIKCYRGVTKKFSTENPQKQVTFNCFTSTSRKKHEAKIFLKNTGGTLFEFDCIPKHALGIEDYSAFSYEQEVLLAPWSYFDVGEVEDEGSFTVVKCYEKEDSWWCNIS